MLTAVLPENWNQWQGKVVDAAFPLHKFLGGSPQSAVFLTDYAGADSLDKAAIKLIPADLQNADAQLAHWRRVAELSHPHLIRLLQMGRCELDNTPLLYVVMELAGENLAEILPRRALTAEETREMLEPVLDGLGYIHEKGFAHTAIKPANLMVVGEQLKISSDRLVPAGERSCGMLAPNPYAPPEAIHGVIPPTGEASPAGDIWSLGMTLVEALTQTLPAWESGSAEGPPLPADLAQPFFDIASHCLRLEVARRWTVAQISARMRAPNPLLPAAAEARELQPASQPRAAAQSREPRSKTRYAAAVIGAVLLAAVFFTPRFLLRHDGDVTPETIAPPSVPPAQPPRVAPPVARATVALPTPSDAPPSPPEANPTPPAAAAAPGAVIERVLPELLPSSRETIQGTVRIAIRVGVDASGNVAMATFDVRGPSGYFADKAMQAARRWKFAPAKSALGYVPVEWLLRFEITRTTTNVFAELADQ